MEPIKYTYIKMKFKNDVDRKETISYLEKIFSFLDEPRMEYFEKKGKNSIYMLDIKNVRQVLDSPVYEGKEERRTIKKFTNEEIREKFVKHILINPALTNKDLPPESNHNSSSEHDYGTLIGEMDPKEVPPVFTVHPNVENLRITNQGIITAEDFDTRILEKIDNGKRLTKAEYEELLFDGYEIDHKDGEILRWQREVTTIVEINGRTFSIEWLEGLTEEQENTYDNTPVEVYAKEETRIVRVWEPLTEKEKTEEYDRD